MTQAVSNDTKAPVKLMTPVFRVSFPHLFRPSDNKTEDGKAKYQLSMLFPPGTDLALLKKAARECAEQHFNGKIPPRLKTPFLDAGTYEYEGYEPGWTLIRVSTTTKPGVVDQNVQPIIDEAEFYPGCWARATVTVYGWTFKGNNGVSFGLQNVQKIKDDDSFGGGRRKAEDDFAPVEGASTGDDIFGGAANEAADATDGLFD